MPSRPLNGYPRVALFLMDYPNRRRLKIDGLAEVLPLHQPGGEGERFLRITVEAFDWNCPQYITPRYTAAEVEARLASTGGVWNPNGEERPGSP